MKFVVFGLTVELFQRIKLEEYVVEFDRDNYVLIVFGLMYNCVIEYVIDCV